MKSVNVHFNTFSDVKHFVELVSKFPFDVDLVSGRYVVNGKSIMGIFSLDLAKDIQADLDTDQPEEILAVIQPYLVP